MDHQNGTVEDDFFSGALVVDERVSPNHMSFTDKLDDIVKAIDGITDFGVAPHTLNKDFSVSTSSIADMAYVAPNEVLNANITNFCQNPLIDNNYQSSVVQSADYMALTTVDTNMTQHLPSTITSYNTGILPQFSESFGNRAFSQNSAINESCTAIQPSFDNFKANSVFMAATTRRASVFSDSEIYGASNSDETQSGDKPRPRKGRPSNRLRCIGGPRNRIGELLEITEKENHLLKNLFCTLENEKQVYLSLLKQRGVFKF